ncbi:zinc knuckle CX2CX4HX4C containing protein [Tanacetum coccineum]|uniref:Zinc knuckle CX2CX4HX4C containing protein n=1 Tax=Tanacetum coccineum TaxID=301880 RepID=A0ABQ5AFK7_9ASTR
MQNTTLYLYPTTSLLTAEISTANLQHQLYLNMNSYTYELFACHDEHHTDVDPPERGEKSEKGQFNRTKLTFLGIEAHSIVDKPTTGLIYLNSKDEKRVMYLMEIVKLCDATLEKVLKEVKIKIFQCEPWKKLPLLGELDRDIMKAFERDISKRLSHRQQMRRWESFVNGRPILPTIKLIEGVSLEACLVTKGATLEANLVTNGITLDASLVAKQSTVDSRTGADAEIRPLYDSNIVSEVHHDLFENLFVHGIQNHEQPESIPDTYVVNEKNINIISDISNMDPDRDKGEHDYVDDEQLLAYFPALINNLKSDVEKFKNVNLQLNCFEKSLVNEMKDDFKYVMSPKNEFDETCLIFDIQQEFFKTQFESVKSESVKTQFTSLKGLAQVLKQGPWLIRNIPLMLTKWSPNMSLSKDKVTKVPVWVKLHKVPVVAYSEDGLSLIATQIGNPIMLDAFASAMCVDSWGRIRYARALIEVSANKELKKEVTMAVPNIDDEVVSHTLEKIKVEYEWNPLIVLNAMCLVMRLINAVNMSMRSLNLLIVDPSGDDGEAATFGDTNKKDNTNKDDSDSEVEECSRMEYTGFEPCPKTIGGNLPSERRHLWSDLGMHKYVVRGFPWVLMGDFNVALNLEDSFSGSSTLNSAMYDFKACVNKIEVMDINATGLHFTWNQKPKGGGGVLKKLDRIMGNIDFIDTFPGAYAIFQPYRILDHSPAVLKLPTLTSPKPKPFKFFNFLAFKTRFIEVMESHWNTQIDGHNMFKVVSKMKLLKKPLRKLLHDQGNLYERVNNLRLKLDEVQKALDTNLADSILREEECVYVQAFNEAKLDEERFLKQKAKVDWLEAGDTNSAYFHKTIKCRNQRSRIDSILNTDNVEVSGNLVPDVFVSHYEQFLGSSTDCNILNEEGLFSNKVPADIASNMVRDVTNDEIKAAMFDIGDDRAPGPDGYTSVFFKKGWDIVGDDICNALINVCFADDLFIFARGDVESSRVIMDSLKEFKLTSGLIPSIPKSTAYFWLLNRDCKILVEKAKNRIGDWKNKSLSFAGRLQLCMDLIPPFLQDILLYLLPMGNKRTAKSVFGKLILAASAYFIWMEQNNRTFKNTRRSPEEICDLIMVTVRLKLISFRFKNTIVVRQLLERWKMPNNFRLYGN